MLTNEVVSFEQPGPDNYGAHGLLPELQIRGNIGDNSKMIFLISQRKHTL